MQFIPPLLMCLILLTSCATEAAPQRVPAATIPEIDVWVIEDNALTRMDVESYVACVVAGEMPSDWPTEALRAQAILARTYVMKFLSEKESRYPGADISTDIAEAQAYDASAVNERILSAVRSTRGMILLTEDGSMPYTWFHAHSGGTTALATESLDWRDAEPSHTRVTSGLETVSAAWTAEFTTEEFLAACANAGFPIADCEEVAIGETGPSGRAVTLLVDGTPINAARLRISLGSTRMRSTLLTELVCSEGTICMSGQGYGHGVGMPQWGAHAMARSGKTGEEIALHYYYGLHLEQIW